MPKLLKVCHAETQEALANLALELESANVLALKTRVRCRQRQKDLHGGLKDLMHLQKLGYTVSTVCTLSNVHNSADADEHVVVNGRTKLLAYPSALPLHLSPTQDTFCT